MQLKEKEREGNEMQKQLAEKDRTIDKLIEDKERKNLEINALRLDSRAIEGKQEYEDIKREL
jgi:surfactin synthase thioesterase subunit